MTNDQTDFDHRTSADKLPNKTKCSSRLRWAESPAKWPSTSRWRRSTRYASRLKKTRWCMRLLGVSLTLQDITRFYITSYSAVPLNTWSHFSKVFLQPSIRSYILNWQFGIFWNVGSVSHRDYVHVTGKLFTKNFHHDGHLTQNHLASHIRSMYGQYDAELSKCWKH